MQKGWLATQVSRSTLEFVQRQVRERAARENRPLTISLAIREALVAYGIKLEETKVQTATLPQ